MFYDFSCRECGFEEEKQFSISDLPSVLNCPSCGALEFKQDMTSKSKTLGIQIPVYMRAGEPLSDRKRDYNSKDSNLDNVLDATGLT